MAWACDFEFSGDGVSVPRAQIPAQGRHADWPLSFSGELVLFSQPPVYLQVPSFTQGEGKLTSNPLSRIHTHTLCGWDFSLFQALSYKTDPTSPPKVSVRLGFHSWNMET